MANILIVLLGFIGMMRGLQNLSRLNFRSDAPHLAGLLLAAILETAGSTIACISVISGQFQVPIILLLGAIATWSFSDQRESPRTGESKWPQA